MILALLWCVLGLAGPVDDGDAAFARGDHPAALVAWTDALAQARKAGDEALEFSLVLRLAAAQRELGKTDLAQEVVGRASQMANTPSRKAEVDLAWGRLALHNGDYKSAEDAFRRAFRGYQGQRDPQGAANAALNLGVSQIRVGDRVGAWKSLSGAKELFTSLDDEGGVADADVNLALLYRADGKLREARDRLDEALGRYRAADDSDGQADTLTNLAAVEGQLARPHAARTHLQQALRLAQGRRDLARQGSVHQQLAALALRGGDLSTAGTHLQAAVTAFTEVGRAADAAHTLLDMGVVRPLNAAELDRVSRTARSQNDLRLQARVALLRGQRLLKSDPGESKKQADNALKLAKRLEMPDLRWQALALSATLARNAGDAAGAIALLDRAVDLLERRRRLLPPDDASVFVQEYAAVYHALADLHLSAGRPLEALATTERLALSEQPLDQPALSALAQREAAMQTALGDEIARHGESSRCQELRSNLASLRVEFADTVDRLRTEVGDLDARVRVAPEDLEALQSELPEDVAVLQPILLPDRLVLLVFTRQSLRAVSVEVPADEVEATLAKLTRALRAGFRDRSVLDPLAARLGTWLWAPVAEVLAEHATVVVSTSGPLRQLPFGLLRHGDRYLVQTAAVATISHVGSLRGAPQPLRVEGRSLLLVGNPDGTLPGAEAEVQALAGAFSGASVLVGDAASRQAVLSRLEGRTTLHLATHGRIDPVEPARSYLVLAGDEAEARLGYREIPGLAPYLSSARIVVLSACESGRPVEAQGGEGVISIQGLAAQFRRAGVETLVASLWKVDDAGTKALMQAFYRELATGKDAALAMADAQRSLLDDPEHGTPWVWAAFVVAGDWR